MSELRPDHPFNTTDPELAAMAKECARARGHKDAEAIIMCSDGERHGIAVPVWQFYIAEATLMMLDSSLDPRAAIEAAIADRIAEVPR
jgi:hypothetical protein